MFYTILGANEVNISNQHSSTLLNLILLKGFGHSVKRFQILLKKFDSHQTFDSTSFNTSLFSQG